MREFRIFGVRRSGNHAFIEWLASHFQHAEHFNDCVGWNPYTAYSRHEYGDLKKEIDCRIISYEDFEPSAEEIQHTDTLILLRDYYNVAASRVQSDRGLTTARARHCRQNSRSVKEVWLAQAALAEAFPSKLIVFNRWAVSGAYRAALETRLGLSAGHYTNRLPQSGVGRGSSFGESRISSWFINRRFLFLSQDNRKVWLREVEDQHLVQTCQQIFNLAPLSGFKGQYSVLALFARGHLLFRRIFRL